MKNIEILAPAGSYDAMVAAVRMGADAVYLGSKALNARRNATNFDDDELFEAVKYCHVRGVKVHQTLNTLMYDSEIEQVSEAIRTAVQADVDALIIQDLGVLELAKKIAPNMPLHASTQMAIHNLAGVKEAEKLGFTRVVLARELSKTEIAYIAKNTTLETEVFIHGALCMSISGQCYLSSMIGERSGNRGLCAQPCRLPFCTNRGIEYGLSLKDLSLVDKAKELMEIGVTSVKIEGRMKRPEYVAASVNAVKSAINGEKIDLITLQNVFSRSGFTNGYYTSNIDEDMFGTRQKEDVVAASTVLKELERSYAKETPLIPLDFKLTVQSDKPIELICNDNDGHTAKANGEIPQIAINKPTTREKAEQSLYKTGGTPYFVEKFECNIEDGLIVPVSELNALRRDTIDSINYQREQVKSNEICEFESLECANADMKKAPVIRIRLERFNLLTDKVLTSAELITMPIKEVSKWVKAGNEITDNICAELENVEFSTDNSFVLLKDLKSQGLNHVYASTLWGINAAKECGIKNIHGGFNLNIFNSEAFKMYANMGLCDSEVSFELNLPKIAKLQRPINTGIVAYGYLPLMTVRNCPVKVAIGCENCKGWNKIRDRMEVDFFINCSGGPSKIYNSVPLYMAERMKELKGLDFVTLYFTKESINECERIITAYQNNSVFDGNITRGLYYRNVL